MIVAERHPSDRQRPLRERPRTVVLFACGSHRGEGGESSGDVLVVWPERHRPDLNRAGVEFFRLREVAHSESEVGFVEDDTRRQRVCRTETTLSNRQRTPIDFPCLRVLAVIVDRGCEIVQHGWQLGVARGQRPIRDLKAVFEQLT
jgi:hypothetical protein